MRIDPYRPARIPTTLLSYKKKKYRGNAMPFVSIRILEGHSQKRKNEISRRVTEAISEVAELPKEAIWVVIEDVPGSDWFVGGKPVREPKAS